MIDALARWRDHAKLRIQPSIRLGGSMLIACSTLVLANCTPAERPGPQLAIAPSTTSSETVAAAEPATGRSKASRGTDRPYVVGGKKYTPKKDASGYSGEGLASWYGPRFHGKRTSNGEIFDASSISAAHRTLPLPSYARVTNTANGKSIVVRVNDRGPFHDNRVVDVSERTAELLDFRRKGMAKVKVEYVGPANERGSDNEKLLATLTDQKPGIASSAVTMLASLIPGRSHEEAKPEAEPPHASAPVAVAAALPKPSPTSQPALAANAPAQAKPTTQGDTKTAETAATKPQTMELAEATPADAISTPPETTADAQIASRIAAGFASVPGSPPPMLDAGQIGAPVLGSMAFSPPDLRGSR